MSRPRIAQDEGQIGFHWVSPAGAAIALPDVMRQDEEPDRLLATHLEALDDAMIIAAGRFGPILGGGRRPSGPAERDDLRELHRVLDRLSYEYHAGLSLAGLTAEARAGQIIGTAALFALLARRPLGLVGPAPFDGQLSDPGRGVVGGYGEMHQVDPDQPWRGGRWVALAEAGLRYPATLAMLLFDSSGVNKEAALEEHREALRSVITAAGAGAGAGVAGDLRPGPARRAGTARSAPTGVAVVGAVCTRGRLPASECFSFHQSGSRGGCEE